LAGVYLHKEDLSQGDVVTFGTDTASYIDTAFLGGGGLLNTLEFLSGNSFGSFFQRGTGTSTLFSQESTTASAFAQLDFDVTPELTLTAGISYVRDEKELEISQFNTDAFSNINLFSANGGIIPAVIGVSATSGIAGLQFNPQLVGLPNQFEDGKTDDDDTNFTLKAAYDFSDQVNAYVSYATGYKATSFNFSNGTRPPSVAFSQLFPNPSPGSNGALLGAGSRLSVPEESEVWEVGIKTEFDRARLYLTVFDQSIDNFQSVVFLGTTFGFSNAGIQTVQGLEFEAQWEATDNLSISAAGTYLDAEYEVFTNSPAGGDISGTSPGNVSEFSGNLALRYNFELSDNPGFVRIGYQYESDVDTEDGGDLNPLNLVLNNGITRERGVSSVNASAGLTVGNLDFTVWVRNLFDDQYVLQNAPPPLQAGSVNTYLSIPRTFGVNARYNF
jgi:outer membrane receptor protein involved in Fe transport